MLIQEHGGRRKGQVVKPEGWGADAEAHGPRAARSPPVPPVPTPNPAPRRPIPQARPNGSNILSARRGPLTDPVRGALERGQGRARLVALNGSR